MQDMRERICEKAFELFLNQGYDNTALSQIARECDLTKAGLYHYFENKEVLLYEVHKRHVESHFKPMLERVEKISDPSSRLLEFIRSYIDLMTRDPHASILIRESKRMNPQHQEDIRKSWQRAYNIVKDAILELQKAKQFKNLNPAFSSFSLIGMMTWIFYWFDYDQKASVDELTATFQEIFLHGMSEATS